MCRVTSTDYVDTLLARGRARAEAEALEVRYEIADAEQLPYNDETFDAVVSTFGVMFAPNQEQAASEMLRVCRRDGLVGLANWTPAGFIGEVFKTLGRHVAPPIGLNAPARWGTESWITETFGPHARAMAIEHKAFVFRYASPERFIDAFRAFYGPIHKAYLALDTKGQAALTSDLLDTIARFNTAKDGSMRTPSDYAEIVMAKA
jgi:ubiquinone/menaquinone biosynthesis C-methylase UbiE